MPKLGYPVALAGTGAALPAATLASTEIDEAAGKPKGWAQKSSGIVYRHVGDQRDRDRARRQRGRARDRRGRHREAGYRLHHRRRRAAASADPDQRRADPEGARPCHFRRAGVRRQRDLPRLHGRARCRRRADLRRPLRHHPDHRRRHAEPRHRLAQSGAEGDVRRRRRRRDRPPQRAAGPGHPRPAPRDLQRRRDRVRAALRRQRPQPAQGSRQVHGGRLVRDGRPPRLSRLRALHDGLPASACSAKQVSRSTTSTWSCRTRPARMACT